jgi:hypothetical protein
MLLLTPFHIDYGIDLLLKIPMVAIEIGLCQAHRFFIFDLVFFKVRIGEFFHGNAKAMGEYSLEEDISKSRAIGLMMGNDTIHHCIADLHGEVFVVNRLKHDVTLLVTIKEIHPVVLLPSNYLL